MRRTAAIGDAEQRLALANDAVAAGHGCFGRGHRHVSPVGHRSAEASSAGAPLWRFGITGNHYYGDNGSSSGAGGTLNRRAVLETHR